MGKDTEEHLEARTQELGTRLWELVRRYHPDRRERQQDWLMNQMTGDPVLKSRLLRFLDALAALDFDRQGILSKRLFREYLGTTFPHSSPLLRALFFLYRQSLVPAGLVAGRGRATMQDFASRFISPPDFGAVSNILKYLEGQGRYPTFDLLGEEVLSEAEAEGFRTRYLEMINHLKTHPWAGRRTPGGTPALQLSIKLSSLTENFHPADPEGTLRRVRGRLEEIARGCASGGLGLNIDAELYEYRELVWHIFSEVFGPGSTLGQWDGAGITVQSYFKDSEEHLRDVLEFAGRRQAPFEVRLAKGAYWDYEVITARQNEWPVPVWEHKNETDRTFQRMLGRLMEYNGQVIVAVASHNIRDHAYAEALRESLGLPPGAIEHQTLFRTAEGVARAIRQMGWELREYVPSGELVPGMAYLVRRVLENTSPVGFLRRLRAGEGAAGLLRPAETSTATVTEARVEGFHNHPPKRLFLADERQAFQSALKDSKAQWGQEYPLELGGHQVKTQEVKPSLSPSHPDPHQPVGLVHLAGVEEAEQAVALARQGFTRWSATPLDERATILTSAAERLGRERDALAAWIVHEGGRTWAEALADVDEAVDHLAYQAHRLRECRNIIEEGYRPRGVVAVISPWNFPAALPAGMLSGALAAGNAVILKSAEQTPVIGARLVKLLHEAGIPPDALLHLPGWGEAGDYLVRSPQVDMVAFTGSRAVGLGIIREASSVPLASAVKRVIAEMGGKNPIIVFPDADLDEAVRGILLSAFEHANQKCSACSRVFVHRSIFPHLEERLVPAAASLPVGLADEPSTLVNPLIEPEARERVLAYARKARGEGRVLVDRLEQHSSSPLQVGPLVVELGLSRLPGSAIAREEIFGPILVLVPFEDEEEMLAQVNGTAYALTAGVFSRSPATVARLARAVQAGNLYVNRKITGARVGMEPFGGFRLSGTGPKAGSPDYLFAFLARREGYRTSQTSSSGTDLVTNPHFFDKVTPWAAEVGRRRDVLQRCLHLLEGESHDDLLRALQNGYRISLPEATKIAEQLLDVASKIIESVREIAESEPTINRPGQKNYMTWETPRGKGFAAAGEETPAERWAGMVFGPLLAGNGLVLVPAPPLETLTGVLVSCLFRAGVPRAVLSATPGGLGVALALAADLFHFAVTDLPLPETQQLYQRLGETREAEGQWWVKALISLPEVPQPGEPGFLRLFALPKTVAIRTLRHGAELEIPPV